MMSLGSGAGALGRVKVGFGNVIAEVEGVVAEPVPPPLALGHPVAESHLHATQRDRARAQLGDAAVVLESREQWQVEPGWFHHQFADLPLLTGFENHGGITELGARAGAAASRMPRRGLPSAREA